MGAYLYLKATTAVSLPATGDGELSYTWWPEAVNLQGAGAGGSLNVAAIRASVYTNYADHRWHVFALYRRGQLVTGTPPTSDPKAFNGLVKAPGETGGFGVEKRSDWENIIQIGLGICF